MTISSTTVKNSYSGNGTLDTFNYTFKIFADADIQVIIRDATATETVKTLTTHYTVTGAGSASGGTIVFTAGNIPTATETVVIRRASPQTQAIDYIANDPFPAESHEEGLDRSMMAIQQLQEEVDRSIKLSRTNTMNSTEFTIGDTDRANKVFGFDSAGELVVTQELGTFRGDWSASTAYEVRDIVKDTSTNNIFICLTAHTSSGSEPLTTNTDSAKWSLLVDAESATTSATNAANSATAAATSATNAATSETNAATSETNAATSATNAANSFDSFDDRFLGTKASDPTLDNDGNALVEGAMYYNSTDNDIRFYNGSSWDAPATQAATSATASASSATASATSATASSNSATASASSASAAATSESNASTSETNAASSASAASTSASNASTSETNAATSATTATTQATNAAASATAAQTAQTAAELALDNFDDIYLGAKSSDPTVDNDGDPLAVGMLYYNTVSNIMRIYSGSAWENVAVSTSGFATLSGVETLTNKTLTSPKIGTKISDTNGNELLNLTATSSAVNELTIANAATGNKPTFTASGGDTNIGVSIQSKGSGTVTIDALTFPAADGSADQVLKTDGSGNLSFTDVSGGTDWQSTIVTGTTLTAVAGNGYWIDTTSNACTITLPASASVGDTIEFVDYARTWGTNSIFIDSNGLNYQGNDDTYTVEYNTNGQSVNIVYSGATKGWIPLEDDAVADAGVAPPTQKGIFAFGSAGGVTNVSNLVNSSGVVATDTTGVGTARRHLAASSYGGDKAIFAFGFSTSNTNISNLVSNSGVVASDTTGVGTSRAYLAGVGYGDDKAIFAYGVNGGLQNISNLVSNSGVVATDTSGVGTARQGPGASRYGSTGQAIVAFGNTGGSSYVNTRNLISNTGVVASDATGAGTARAYTNLGASYGGDKGIIAYGYTGSNTNISNLISNTGVVSSDVSGVGTARESLAGTNYGGDKAIYAYGSGPTAVSNLVSNTGVVSSDVTGVGTARTGPAAAGYSFNV